MTGRLSSCSGGRGCYQERLEDCVSFHYGGLQLTRGDTSRPPRRVRRIGVKVTLARIPVIDA